VILSPGGLCGTLLYFGKNTFGLPICPHLKNEFIPFTAAHLFSKNSAHLSESIKSVYFAWVCICHKPNKTQPICPEKLHLNCKFKVKTKHGRQHTQHTRQSDALKTMKMYAKVVKNEKEMRKFCENWITRKNYLQT